MQRDDNIRIALNLRRLRSERGLSLSDLARESGISRATLSKVEAGTGNPTIGTLSSLAAYLNVSLDDVINGEESRLRVVRSDEGTWLKGAAVGYRLTDRIFGRDVVDVYDSGFAAGVHRNSEGHGLGTFEHLFVTEGRLRVGPIGEVIELEAGDYARFPADRTHTYEAVGGDSRALMLISHVRAPSGQQEMQRELEHLLSGGDEPQSAKPQQDSDDSAEANSGSA